MRESRSASQILFGYLPQQTVDIGGGVWRVVRWVDARIEREVDLSALRDELIRLAYRWEEQKLDGGFVMDLRRGAEIKVKSLDLDRGVWAEPFPRQWVCRACKRVHDDARGACQCGHRGYRGQLPFVGYHDACGALKEPWIPRCNAHDQVAIRFPGTASAEEIVFYCPVCHRELKRGLRGARCDCAAGGMLVHTVHRAASVYTPRSVVIVNPPSQRRLQQLEDLGGGAAAMDWILSGLPGEKPGDAASGPSHEALRRQLLSQGFAADVVDRMLAAGGLVSTTGKASIAIPGEARAEAESQAKTIALALIESRMTIGDLSRTMSDGQLRHLYDDAYPRALGEAGLERVELVDKFPVLTGQFGYTRGDTNPGASRLRAFRERDGSYSVYGDLARTEALFVRLSPQRVARWLRRRRIVLDDWSDDRSAATAVLCAARQPSVGDPVSGNEAGRLLLGLVHSFAHRFIRLAAVFAGIERSSLSELLVPLHLGFFTYAAARGDFVLGGLQALFESELHELLRLVVHGEHRCALDPGCAASRAACAVCLHLGEPSCRLFNTHLSRTLLFGDNGYFAD